MPRAPVEIIDQVQLASDGGKAAQALVLRKRGPFYDIVLGHVVLLSSAALGTEIEFGTLAKTCRQADATPKASHPMRVLVGGLGFGGTARGALSVMPKKSELHVIEKLEPLVAWLKGPLAKLAEGALSDSRLRIVNQDVYETLETPASWDAILLDVDNGPDWASFRTNARLYAPEGLLRARAALRPGGVFAVWSGYDAPKFIGALRRAGFQPELVPLREGKGGVVQARAYVGRAPT
jgi:predicted membrane-bound spermidine synthase